MSRLEQCQLLRLRDAWHSSFELPGQCTGERTPGAPASIDPVRREKVTYLADRAASLAPEARLRRHSHISLSQGGVGRPQLEGAPYSALIARASGGFSGLPLCLIASAIAHSPRISGEALRKRIEKRSDRGNHAAPRWEHSMDNTGPGTERRQQPNQCTAR